MAGLLARLRAELIPEGATNSANPANLPARSPADSQIRRILTGPLPANTGAATEHGTNPALAEAFEERAGILEFDGGMDRAEAETVARLMLHRGRFH